MIVIGENINGSIPKVKRAIEAGDKEYIQKLAMAQAEAGADFIDVSAGVAPGMEVKTLEWLIDIVQDAVRTPLSIDSPNVDTIKKVINKVTEPGIVNSVSGEANKCDTIFPLIRDTNWQVVALACDGNGIPNDVDGRVHIAKAIIAKAERYGIALDRIHLDPIVMALSTDDQAATIFINTVKKVKVLYPEIKITSGLSNISFGMPLRKLINANFLTLAIFAGMNSGILDPLDQGIVETIRAAEALMGKDKHCKRFNDYYRSIKQQLKN